MAKKQSIGKLAAKHAARTAGRRMTTNIFGTGIMASIAGVLISAAVKKTDDLTLNEDKDFGTITLETKNA